ncbi:MAG: HAMP domain-containing histidine kinase [Anaerolineales bacterium]|nr:HAMP domain-containing histidine kinase [Anaerolineales bacterium]
MTDPDSVPHHLPRLQKQVSDPTRQPLEIYHLSHDLRGPLNSILGFAELLQEEIEGPLNEIQKADIAAIYQSAQNLLHLIHTMVDLSKLDANLITVDVRTVDLNDAVESVLPVLSKAKPEPTQLNLALPPDLPPLRADRVRLEQILRNLLRRAFKLTPKGSITLSAERSGPEMILCLEIGHVELLQAEIAELFELGIKTDSSGRNEIGWGGLDLPLVRYLAEQQQGRVWAERYQDSGLAVYVALPVAD